MKNKIIHYVEGDTSPVLSLNLNKDITGAAVKFVIDYPTKLEKAATIMAAATGDLEIAWAAGDLQKGKHACQIEIAAADGTVQTIGGMYLQVEAKI